MHAENIQVDAETAPMHWPILSASIDPAQQSASPTVGALRRKNAKRVARTGERKEGVVEGRHTREMR